MSKNLAHLEKKFGKTKRQLHRWISSGDFPRQDSYSGQTPEWHDSTLEAFEAIKEKCASLPLSSRKDQLRAPTNADRHSD